MDCNALRRLVIVSAACLGVIASTACRYPGPGKGPPPPRATEEVRWEVYALEGSETCKATRDFLLDEVSPYFGAIDALNR